MALRRVGGYQLLVDATDEEAVRRLRQRKGRRAKPLAVMVDSSAGCRALGRFRTGGGDRSDQLANPIVVCSARDNNGLADAVSLHLDRVGLMLPTTPLHALLLHDVRRPLVCTSGNRDGDPLEYELTGPSSVWPACGRLLSPP